MRVVGATGVCEESVYNQVFKTESPGLFRFLTYKTGSETKARDILQDSFAKLWEKCADVLPEKAKSFLFTIANNAFLNEVKREKVRFEYAPITHKSDLDIESPEYKMRYDEYKQSLEEAINNLPEGQREVFLLNRVEKHTYKEIAEMLDVSQKAIEKRMSKALQKLKEILTIKE
ncbi:MAG: sigma-70 family RNA polymerase sigma factor [Bacteroidia bacterium]